MFTKLLGVAVSLSAVVTQAVLLAPGATAADVPSAPAAATIVAPARDSVAKAAASFTRADYVDFAKKLLASETPRTSQHAGKYDVVTFSFGHGVHLQLAYKAGKPVVPSVSAARSGATKTRHGFVKFGAVWWSVYVELSSAEQSALAAGSVGVILGALSRNAVAAGVAATIIAVATAEGVCSKHRPLRIYIPSFLMTECV